MAVLRLTANPFDLPKLANQSMFCLCCRRTSSAQRPHNTHFCLSVIIPSGASVSAPLGHTFRQVPQPRHFLAVYSLSFPLRMPSGLWHHWHFRGQPFRNITVLIPGPSLTAKRLMSKAIPFSMTMRRSIYLLTAISYVI